MLQSCAALTTLQVPYSDAACRYSAATHEPSIVRAAHCSMPCFSRTTGPFLDNRRWQAASAGWCAALAAECPCRVCHLCSEAPTEEVLFAPYDVHQLHHVEIYTACKANMCNDQCALMSLQRAGVAVLVSQS